MRRIAILLLAAVLPWLTYPVHAGEGSTPQPKIVLPADGKCIDTPENMRRNHMDMLKHQRNRTLREGIRGEKASLNDCIQCHAGKSSGSVLGHDDSFCQSCHSYAAVKLDCWDCHQPKAGYKATGAKPHE